MPEVTIKDVRNKDAGTLKLNDEVFGIEGKEALMHTAVVNLLANKRQGTHSTKTRGLVSGGGRKPYKQKGTGRARAGSSRSPLWRGGGTIFGPMPRDYSYSIPRKARRQALYAALSAKIKDGEILVVDDLKMDAPKTSAMVGVLSALEVPARSSLLIVIAEADVNVMLSARNIPGVRVSVASDLNAYSVLAHDRLLATRAAMESLEKRAMQ
jgi:large subunit ribosomal protein L4